MGSSIHVDTDELTPAELLALNTESFEELQSADGLVSAEAFRAWEDVADLLADGVVTHEG